MRNLHMLDVYRLDVRAIHGWNGDGTCGSFRISSPIDQQSLLIQASSEGGWDHVSVSRKNRPPNWAEMERVRRLFFKDEETVMQLHVPLKLHINMYPNCLHMWRPQNEPIPMPPDWMV